MKEIEVKETGREPMNAEKPRRVLGTREYVSILKDLVEEGKDAAMTIVGSSMSPFLVTERDRIFFRSPDRPLRRGDIVFYQRESGQFVCHRIYQVKPEGYYMVGDAQTEIEGPLRREQIFARIFQVQRKGKIMTSGDFWWMFFEKVWIRMVPLRPFVVKLVSLVRRRK